MNILFICTGNTCRSPMAKVLCERIFMEEGIAAEIDSAGVAVFAPMPASANAMEAMAEQGLSLETHLSKQVDRDMLNKADLILTMTLAHVSYLKKKYSDINHKIYCLGEYTGENCEISDPYAKPLAAYQHCADDLENAIRKVAFRLKSEGERNG